MEYRFIEQQEMINKLNDLLKRWDVRYNIFLKIVKDEFPPASRNIKEKLKKKDLNSILSDVNEIGGILEEAHNHLQDLGAIYTQMWSAVKDSEKY